MATTQGLYSQRLSNIMGMAPPPVSIRFGNDRTAEHIKRSAESLSSIETDNLDAGHDILYRLDEQIVLLKKMNRNLTLLNERQAIGNASSILDNITDVFGGGKGNKKGGIFRRAKNFFGRGTSMAGSLVENIKSPKVVKTVAGLAAGAAATAAAYTSSAFSGGVSFIKTGIASRVRLMSSTILGSISELSGSMGTLFKEGLTGIGKAAVKLLGPALAAWGAFEGVKKSMELDPEGVTGLTGRANAGIAGALDNIVFNIPSYLSEWFTGKDFTTMAVHTDLAKEEAIRDYKAKGGKDLYDYLGDAYSGAKNWLTGPATPMFIDQNKPMATTTPTAAEKEMGEFFKKAVSDGVAAAVEATPVSNSTIVPEGASSITMQDMDAALGPSRLRLNNSKEILGNINAARGAQAAVDASKLLTPISSIPSEMNKNTLVTRIGNERIVQELKKQTRLSEAEVAGSTGTVAPDTGEPKTIGQQVYDAKPANNSIPNNSSKYFDEKGNVITSPELVRGQGSTGKAESSAVTDARGKVMSTANTDLTVKQRSLLDTIAIGNPNQKGSWESPDYNTISGGTKFNSYTDHPRTFGKAGTTAAGRYQFTKGTWDSTVRDYNKANPNNPITDFSPKNQDRAALFLAAKDYKRRSGGRDLMADMESGADMGPLLKQYLGGSGLNTTWQVFQKKSASSITNAYAANVEKNQGYATDPSQLQKSGGSVVTNNLVKENQASAGIRRDPVQSTLRDQLQFAAEKTGVEVEIGSGGQMSLAEAKAAGARQVGKKWFMPDGTPVRTGSERHDHGGAADLKLYVRDPDTGKRRVLDMNNPADAAKMQEFTTQTVRAGATGVGAGQGYMGSQTLHIGGGKPASWGGAPWIESARQAGVSDRESGKREFEAWQAARIAAATPTKDPFVALRNDNGMPKFGDGAFANSPDPSTILGKTYTAPSPFDALKDKPWGVGSAGSYMDNTLQQQGESIGKGIVRAQQDLPKVTTFDASEQQQNIMGAVEQTPANSVVASQPKGKSSGIAQLPDINSIPHTDELSMMLANTEMMA